MITGNEPAYPVGDDYQIATEDKKGLTIRQHFAIMAQQAMLSDNDNNDSDNDWFAKKSVSAADALIAELNKT